MSLAHVAAHAEPFGDETVALAARADAAEAAVALAGARMGSKVASRVHASVAGVRERLALGVDHTVVVLAGGTGSGKSSLFNRVSGLTFADVGVRRPTTAEVTACVWGGGADALLDWLEVSTERRIERESLLDGESEALLRGLVLLDLPDHDSIEPEHRAVVDRVLPQADLIVWVVDPQKYADDALHSGYLERLVGHEASMLVVLNQIDTVRDDERRALLDDVARLLVADGLAEVPVLPASTRTGEGVPEIRDLFADAARARSLAARRASAELDDVARELERAVGDREPPPASLSVTGIVDTFAQAAGLRAVAEAAGAVVRGSAVGVPAIGGVHRDTVELARDAWLAGATAGLPRRWVDEVAERAAGPSKLGAALGSALSGLTVTARRSGLAVGLAVLSLVLTAAAVLAGAVAAGAVLGDGDLSRGGAIGIGAACAVGALACALAAVGVRRAASRRRTEQVLRDGRAAIEAVAREHLQEPALAVLAERQAVRAAVVAARG